MQPGAAAALVMAVTSLQKLTLEDVYSSGIWGPRIRQTDVMAIFGHLEDEDLRKQRLGAVVECTARLERIIGGDRGS